MALRQFDKTEKINCEVVAEVSTDFLAAMAWTDAFGCMLVYGLSPKEMGQKLHLVVAKLDDDIKSPTTKQADAEFQRCRHPGVWEMFK